MVKPVQNRRSVAPYVVLVVVTLLAMWPTVRGDFTTWDDADTIARNRDLNPVTGESFVHFWTQAQGDLYVPVTYTVWAALAPLARMSRPDAGGVTLGAGVYHGFNLVVHVGSVLLAYHLLRRLTGKGWASAMGAAVFAVHPVQVETVAWASGTKDLLAGFFSLAALNFYVAGETRPASGPAERGTMGAVVLATACFVLALLSKPSCVALPLSAVAVGRFMLGRSWREAVVPVVPWLLLAGPAVIVGRWAQPAHVVPYVPPLYLRPIVALDAVEFYLKQLVLPVWLGVDYGRTPRVVLAGAGKYFTLAAAVALAAAVYVWRRSGVVVAAAAIFVAAVLPVLGLIPFDFQQYSTTSDHYLYVAMVGPALLVAWLLPGIEQARFFFRRPAAIAASVVVAVLGARTFAQTFYWSDTMTLFTHALEVNPDSPAARVNLAIALTDRNQLAEAAGHYRALLAVEPSNPKAHLGLGQVLARSNELQEALTHLRTAAGLQPENPLTHYNLGLLLATLGRQDEAIAAYRQALEAEPNFPEGHTNLATALLMRGDLEGAERHYREALRIRPDLTIPRRGLEAVEEARRAGTSKPTTR